MLHKCITVKGNTLSQHIKCYCDSSEQGYSQNLDKGLEGWSLWRGLLPTKGRVCRGDCAFSPEIFLVLK